MTSTTKIVLGAITGIFMGLAIVFVAIVAAVAFAYATGGRVEIPGVFVGWFTTENSLPALNFQPNLVGILVAILIVAGINVFAALKIKGRRKTEVASGA